MSLSSPPHGETKAPDRKRPFAATGSPAARVLVSPIAREWVAFAAGPAVTAIAYYCGAVAAFLIGTLSDRIFAPFWPPNTILLCALLLADRRRWPLFVVAVFPAHVLAEMWVGMAAPQMLVAFATNCLVALIGAELLKRFGSGSRLFANVRSVLVYLVIAAGVAPALAAFGGAFVPIAGGGAIGDYWQYWASWFAGNALAALTLGPVILAWTDGNMPEAWPRLLFRLGEAALLSAILVVVCSVSFRLGAGTVERGFLPSSLYLPLPIMLWMAYRFGARGASGAILVVAAVSIADALNGSSVFFAGDPTGTVIALQLFLTAVAIPMLFIGSAIDQLQGAERAMRGLSVSLSRAQDNERRQIAHELHEGTAQNLAAAAMLASTDVRNSATAGVAGLIRQSIEELRSVSSLLHPPLLDEAGLAPALRDFIAQYSERTGAAVSLHIGVEPAEVPRDIGLILFRLTAETLADISLGSPEGPVRISLTYQRMGAGEGAILEISIGTRIYRPRPEHRDAFTPGVGLRTVRERLHDIGGTLEIESREGRTVIRGVVPLVTA